jgi:hypothetical protein
MSIWVEHDKDPYIPDWLKGKLPSKCPHCGSPMMNYYNEDLRCTNRKCSNEHCYGFVAAKADFARKLLGVKGIGFAGCLNDATLIHATSPFQLFELWNFKPLVTMEQFLRIHCFEGVDSEWGNITKTLGIYTLDELYEKYDGKWRPVLDKNKDEIYDNAKYVQFVKRPKEIVTKGPEAVFTIMITGTPNGYRTKEDFIDTLNMACKGRIIILHQKTKRQSGVDFLIREPGSTTRGKVDAAKRGGIPIVTSEQFVRYLVEVMNKLNAEEK